MRRARRAFAISAVLAAGMFGCEFIVSNTVPDFTCTPTDPTSCPANQICDPATNRCVNGIGDGGDIDTGRVDGNAGDGGRSEGGSNLAPIGASCTSDNSCQGGLLCGTTNILTTAIVDSTDNSICTKTCCTSADCPANFVCYGPGTGGNYCISTKAADRGAVGTGKPGDTCTTGTDCRSGTCDNSRCLDTCCSATDCASGTTCRVKTINSRPTENWVCAVPEDGSSLDTGDTCSSTVKTCRNDNCSGFPQKCRPPCCSSQECQGIGSGLGVCAYGNFTTTQAQTKWCFDASDAGAPLGASCTGVTDCASRFCDPDQNKCAAVCCEDSDCQTGEVCRPARSGTGASFLRCVGVAAQ